MHFAENRFCRQNPPIPYLADIFPYITDDKPYFTDDKPFIADDKPYISDTAGAQDYESIGQKDTFSA